MSSNCKHCGKQLNMAQSKDDYKSCPRCSTNNGNEHIFYQYPDAFGKTDKRATINHPDGPQSYCTNCRGGNIGPYVGHKKCSE